MSRRACLFTLFLGIGFGLFSQSALAQSPPSGDSEKLGEISADQLRTLFRGKPTEKECKKYCRMLGEYLISQAHPTGTNPTVTSSSSRFDAQSKSVTWTMSVNYGGALTNKKYYGTIYIVVDVSDPKDAEVEKIEFSEGDNFIKPNNANLGDARKLINKLLGK
ncbi:MAG: hypothetical protein U0798_04450 [Gemmataceae bacterium]